MVTHDPVGAQAPAPVRFASSPVEVRRGPSLARVSKKLTHPHPVDNQLLAELRTLGTVNMDGDGRRDAVGIDAPVAAVRAVVNGRARVLTGDDRRLADPAQPRRATPNCSSPSSRCSARRPGSPPSPS
ncbi:hypothetical protein [Streptomyces sp. NPDC002276]